MGWKELHLGIGLGPAMGNARKMTPQGYAAVVDKIDTYFFRRFCATGDNFLKAKPQN